MNSTDKVSGAKRNVGDLSKGPQKKNTIPPGKMADVRKNTWGSAGKRGEKSKTRTKKTREDRTRESRERVSSNGVADAAWTIRGWGERKTKRRVDKKKKLDRRRPEQKDGRGANVDAGEPKEKGGDRV